MEKKRIKRLETERLLKRLHKTRDTNKLCSKGVFFIVVFTMLHIVISDGYGEDRDFNSTIGVINVVEIEQKSEAFQKFRPSLDLLRDKYMEKISKEEEKLREKREQIDKQKGLLSSDDYAKKLNVFNDELLELKKYSEEHSQELNQLYQEARQEIRNKLIEAVAHVAEMHKIDIIFNANYEDQTLFFFHRRLRIDAEVIEKLNEDLPELKTVKVPSLE